MKITIATAGSRGDTQPYLALGVALRKAGHEVTLAASENFGEWVASYGLRFHPVTGDFTKLVNQTDIGAGGGGSPLEFIRTMKATGTMVGPILYQMGGDVLAATQGADVLLSALPLLSVDVAQKTGVPLMYLSVIPLVKTRAFAIPMLPPVPAFLNEASYVIAQRTSWMLFGKTINAFRRDVLDLPAWGSGGPFGYERQQGYRTLVGVSPAVIGQPSDWEGTAEATGYWLLEDRDQIGADQRPYAPSKALQKFLAAGAPPVFVGFGSMPDKDPAATTHLLVEALRLSGQRGIISSGWARLGAADLPETVFKLDYAPFAWLLPQMAMVVHHGGSGTTGAGLASGVPSMVVSHGVDQFFWGSRIEKLGAGPAPLARGKLTAQRLAEAITRTLADAKIRYRAAEVGDQIRAEDGVGKAVGMIAESF
jgi:UDP:flavonoid glycosyltransferase YjiC (YdhE family)